MLLTGVIGAIALVAWLLRRRRPIDLGEVSTAWRSERIRERRDSSDR